MARLDQKIEALSRPLRLHKFVEATWRLDVFIEGRTKVIEAHRVLTDFSFIESGIKVIEAHRGLTYLSSLITSPCYTVITSDGKTDPYCGEHHDLLTIYIRSPFHS
jgi:hypothetical protein